MMDKSLLSETERLVLDSIQDNFPLESRPYEHLAQSLNSRHGLSLTESEVIQIVGTLKTRGYIRRLGAIFNSKPLGYMTTLCALKIPTDRVDHYAKLLNSYPQVTHNYIRDNPLNLWFTFCYDREKEIQELLNKLKQELGQNSVFQFNSRKIFKIRAVFKLA
ncbi:MAG: Lrp/AsnC family transcriptional regulator [Deltaproteobacteria bacterium]|jgi:DNA-binding Lrp family transcriptional regulator|nr:Lrp/AsnC family transcriptional regulator [Deltaproteobacteria bacterium]